MRTEHINDKKVSRYEHYQEQKTLQINNNLLAFISHRDGCRHRTEPDHNEPIRHQSHCEENLDPPSHGVQLVFNLTSSIIIRFLIAMRVLS